MRYSDPKPVYDLNIKRVIHISRVKRQSLMNDVAEAQLANRGDNSFFYAFNLYSKISQKIERLQICSPADWNAYFEQILSLMNPWQTDLLYGTIDKPSFDFGDDSFGIPNDLRMFDVLQSKVDRGNFYIARNRKS